MKRRIKSLLATLVISLSLAAPVLAGPYEDGIAATDRGDHVTALRLWLPLAEQGNYGAQYNVGVLYLGGKGVLQDYEKAAMWFRKAAEQNDVLAQFKLGLAYQLGNGVPQDYVLAHKWLNLAAAQGEKAAAQGVTDTAKHRDSIVAYMTPAQIAEAQRLAREWKPKK